MLASALASAPGLVLAMGTTSTKCRELPFCTSLHLKGGTMPLSASAFKSFRKCLLEVVKKPCPSTSIRRHGTFSLSGETYRCSTTLKAVMGLLRISQVFLQYLLPIFLVLTLVHLQSWLFLRCFCSLGRWRKKHAYPDTPRFCRTACIPAAYPPSFFFTPYYYICYTCLYTLRLLR